MNHTYSPNDLISLIYNELTPCESFKLKTELVSNPELKAEYNHYKTTIKIMESHEPAPSEPALDNILNVARAYNAVSYHKLKH